MISNRVGEAIYIAISVPAGINDFSLTLGTGGGVRGNLGLNGTIDTLGNGNVTENAIASIESTAILL